ncbi:hypothetical protein HB815_05920 [Listeria booriae]|uniref:glycosyl hydrolase family 28-related protein n=1 Tax=Listeria booriae TaxID=1552123 RepID=UPI001623C0AF|nr:glycosyl hydrolase family 28-related protein [Listeria booriae]MBC1210463.1 hypothetical protein [Listeria booriae]
MAIKEGFINILDCGAKVDGFSDDTSYINFAMKMIEGNGGGTVIFPAGLYVFQVQLSYLIRGYVSKRLAPI